MRLFCPITDCTFTFVNHKCLKNHFPIVHNIRDEKEINELFEKAFLAEARKQIRQGDGDGTTFIGIIDTETTGLIHSDVPLPKIVEVALKILDTTTTYSSLVHPGMDMPPAATAINGITDNMLKPAPPFEVVGPALLEAVADVVSPQDTFILLAHNMVAFDHRILEASFKSINLSFPPNWVFVDTLPLFRTLYPKLKKYSLKHLHTTLCPQQSFNQHRADGDVLALEQCLKAAFPTGNFVDNLLKTLYK